MQASTAPHSKAPPPERRHSQIKGCVPRFHALQRRYLIWGPFLRLVRRVRPRNHSQLLYHSPEIRALKCVPGCQTLKPGAREKALRREPAPPVAKRGGGASRRSIVQQSAPDCARSTRLEDLGWWGVGRCCQRGRASLSAACSRGRPPAVRRFLPRRAGGGLPARGRPACAPLSQPRPLPRVPAARARAGRAARGGVRTSFGRLLYSRPARPRRRGARAGRESARVHARQARVASRLSGGALHARARVRTPHR